MGTEVNEIPISNLQVLIWLGRWRDELPTEAIHSLQDICHTRVSDSQGEETVVNGEESHREKRMIEALAEAKPLSPNMVSEIERRFFAYRNEAELRIEFWKAADKKSSTALSSLREENERLRKAVVNQDKLVAEVTEWLEETEAQTALTPTERKILNLARLSRAEKEGEG